MSDLTFGPSFKVKRWFTGFGELSFQWIHICIGSPMRRSIFYFERKYRLNICQTFNEQINCKVDYPRNRMQTTTIKYTIL